MRPEFAFRGGVIVPALGRFNVYHDSNLNLTTIRPLLNQFVVPTAYSDTGLGVRGRLRLPRRMKLSYELDLVNGMSAAGESEEGEDEGGAPPSRGCSDRLRRRKEITAVRQQDRTTVRQRIKLAVLASFVVAAALAKSALLVPSVAAKPAFMDRYDRDEFSRAELRHDCTVCHAGRGGGERNDFGEAFEDAGYRITPRLREKFPALFVKR